MPNKFRLRLLANRHVRHHSHDICDDTVCIFNRTDRQESPEDRLILPYKALFQPVLLHLSRNNFLKPQSAFGNIVRMCNVNICQALQFLFFVAKLFGPPRIKQNVSTRLIGY